MTATDIEKFPIHLGRGGMAVTQPEFTGDMNWYMDYMRRHAADGAEGWLVSMHTFTAPWEGWEMHPAGHEIVVCTAGEITIHQEKTDGSRARVTLRPGQYAINEPGTWHTADVNGAATALFITCGMGTESRAR